MSDELKCDFVIDHFAARRCGEDADHSAYDENGEPHPVCSQHAAALMARGLNVVLKGQQS
jgi:hypothetical protein